MKKFIVGLSALTLAFSAAPAVFSDIGTYADDSSDGYAVSGDYSYELFDDSSVCIMGYHGNEKNVVIPKTIKGKKVSGIGDFAFAGEYDKATKKYSSDLESVEIPDSVDSIGYGAFSHCVNLKSIKIPEGVTYIPNETFDGCTALEEISLPKSVTGFDSYAFRSTPWLDKQLSENDFVIINGSLVAAKAKKTVVFPDSITEIPSSVFVNGGETVEEITIGKNVKNINGAAFRNCTALKKVTLNDGLETIGNCAFLGCTSLKTITVPKSVENIGEYAYGFYEDNDENVPVEGFYLRVYRGSQAAVRADEEFINYKFVGRKVQNPSAVSSITVKTDKGKTNVSWKKAKGADFYRVYYRKSGEKKWTYAKNTYKTSFTANGLSKGSYILAVRSYRRIGGFSYYSPAVRKTFVKK